MARLRSQLAAGLTRLREREGETVTYVRGATSLTVNAVVGEQTHDSVDAAGMPIVVQSRDYFIRVADLTLGKPQKGDRITEDGVDFVVRDIGGSPAWKYSDMGRTAYRVHTVEVPE